MTIARFRVDEQEWIYNEILGDVCAKVGEHPNFSPKVWVSGSEGRVGNYIRVNMG